LGDEERESRSFSPDVLKRLRNSAFAELDLDLRSGFFAAPAEGSEQTTRAPATIIKARNKAQRIRRSCLRIETGALRVVGFIMVGTLKPWSGLICSAVY